MKQLLDIESLLDKAFRHFILTQERSYIFNIRNSGGIENFYSLLEHELKTHPFLKVQDFRTIKEGLVRVSRPAKLLLSFEDFFSLRPQLKKVYEKITAAEKNCSAFKFSEFLKSSYSICLRRSEALEDALEVFQYMVQNKHNLKGLLPRQIRHGVSSKLIGKETLLLAMFSFWSGKPGANWDIFFQHFELLKRLPEFRFYAPSCQWQGAQLKNFHGILFKENLNSFSFQDVKRTLVVENIESLLPLVGQCDKTLLIWGEGWKCQQLVSLCEQLPKPLFYWGDLDKEGIEIADQFCSRTLARPVLMDQKTLETYASLVEPMNTPEVTPSILKILDPIYQIVLQKKARIEQEKITLDWNLLNFQE